MIKITKNELEKISELRGTTRYDLIEKLSDVLNASVRDNMRLSKCSKCVRIDDGTKIDISTKKQKDGTLKIVRLDVIDVNFVVNKKWDIYNIK